MMKISNCIKIIDQFHDSILLFKVGMESSCSSKKYAFIDSCLLFLQLLSFFFFFGDGPFFFGESYSSSDSYFFIDLFEVFYVFSLLSSSERYSISSES